MIKMFPAPLNVLFLCTRNAARSILAESILNRIGVGRFKAFSAGSSPARRVAPQALRMLRTLNYEIDGLRPKGWETFALYRNPAAPDLDFVFTLCDAAAGESCPVWPGQPISAHWPVPDPLRSEDDPVAAALALAETYRLLSVRLTAFNALPLRALDRISLQRRLGDIGQMAELPKLLAP